MAGAAKNSKGTYYPDCGYDHDEANDLLFVSVGATAIRVQWPLNSCTEQGADPRPNRGVERTLCNGNT